MRDRKRLGSWHRYPSFLSFLHRRERPLLAGKVGFGQFFFFSARHQFDTWTLAPPEDRWYGVVLWVLRVLGQGLNQSAQIFFVRAFSGCCAILTSPKKRETAVYGCNPAMF